MDKCCGKYDRMDAKCFYVATFSCDTDDRLNKVIAPMASDDISEIVKNDPLIKKFGQSLYVRHNFAKESLVSINETARPPAQTNQV